MPISPAAGRCLPQHARAGVLLAVTRLSPTQFYWEALDVDIELGALECPEHFPLSYRPTQL